MKKLLTIFLLTIVISGSFLPNMDTCELSKIPQLLHHYQEHTALRKQSISFLDFILLHYGAGKASGEHQDQEDHDKLPFHAHTFHAMIAALTETVSFSFYKFESLHFFNTVYLYADYSEYSFSLLQPPRV
jgi:hypothetical protein